MAAFTRRFQMDIDASPKDAITVQGDFYGGTRKTAPEHSPMNGQNVIGRWTHTYSGSSEIMLQLYYDRYFREDIPGTGSDRMNTIDADFQHRVNLKKKHELLWGVGYRVVRDYANFKTQNVAILPPKKKPRPFQRIYSG
jgi:iron complex outermembrane recepter protein